MQFDALSDLTEDAEVSDNVIEDVVVYARGNFIGNEEQAVLSFLQYTTGWFYDMNRFVNSVLIGPSSGGKTMVQKNMAELIPPEYRYETTDSSGNALLDDPEWDVALIAVMDEIDKLSSDIREYFKSMAGEDGGYSKKRDVEDEDSPTGYSPVEVSSDAMPFQTLFAPEGKKSIDRELKNRMIEIPVQDNVHIREAIGKKEANYTDIEVTGLDATYIYGTVQEKRAIRSHVDSLPVETWTIEENDATRRKRRGGAFAEIPRWVWVSLEPIFDKSRTHTNRVYGAIFNAIRASAIANHHRRPTVETTIEDERLGHTRDVDAYVVHPQDVANVLACQRALLATTHELDDRKRAYMDAIRSTQGMAQKEFGEDCGGTTTMNKILQYLDDNDIPHPTRSTLQGHLEELEDSYFIRIRENAAPDGRSHLYELRSEGAIQPPRTKNLTEFADKELGELAHLFDGDMAYDVDNPYEGCSDPIRGQPITKTIADFEAEFSGKDEGTVEQNTNVLADAMDGSHTEDNDSHGDTQASLSSVSDDGIEVDERDTGTELDPQAEITNPTERAVLERVRERCGGEDAGIFGEHHNLIHVLGVVDTDTDFHEASIKGTIFDPEHELWENRPELADDRVVDDTDTRRELDDAYTALKEKGYVQTDRSVGPASFYQVRVAEEQ